MDPKEAQKARSQKYGIAVRQDGHVTKPSEYAKVPDEQFLDPVNYAYPCPDAKQTQAAAAYWGKSENKAQYSSGDQAVINHRLMSMEKKFKMGQAMQAAGEDVVFIGGWSRLLNAIEAPRTDAGWKWHVQIIESGLDKQGTVDYPLSVLHAARPLYEGARVFALTEGQHSAGKHPYGKSVRDLVGMLTSVQENDIGLEGMLTVLKSASWLRDMLLSIQQEGKMDLIGLSHDVLGKVSLKGGVRVAEKIVKVDSVDVVYEPIGGGKFIRMAAAAQAASQKEATMYKQLLAALKGQRPDLKDKIEALEAKGDAVTADEVNQIVAAAVVKPDGGTGNKDEIKEMLTKLTAALTDVTTTQAKDLVAKAQKTFDDATKLMACATTLVAELEGAGLPDMMKVRLRKRYEGKIFEEAELKAAIKEEKRLPTSSSARARPRASEVCTSRSDRASASSSRPRSTRCSTWK